VQGEPPVLSDADGRVDLARTLDVVPEFVEAGANDIFVSLASICPNPGESHRVLIELGERFARMRTSIGTTKPGVS
jgi:hypothetical protein